MAQASNKWLLNISCRTCIQDKFPFILGNDQFIMITSNIYELTKQSDMYVIVGVHIFPFKSVERMFRKVLICIQLFAQTQPTAC